jgi:hypothetical protein
VDACESNHLSANHVTSNGPPLTAGIVRSVTVAEWKQMSQPLAASLPNKFPIVLITWADAHCGEAGWIDLDSVEDDGECIITSVGYLVPAGEGGKAGHVTLYQTHTDGEAIHPFHIPAGMVRETKILT